MVCLIFEYPDPYQGKPKYLQGFIQKIKQNLVIKVIWFTMVNAPYTKDYIGEMDRRNKEKIIDHNKRNNNSHILKHSRKDHSHVWELGFQV